MMSLQHLDAESLSPKVMDAHVLPFLCVSFFPFCKGLCLFLSILMAVLAIKLFKDDIYCIWK